MAGTFDGTLAKLFVDGKLIGEGSSLPGTIEYNGPDGDATIGGYHGSCDLMFAATSTRSTSGPQALPVDQIWKKWGWLLGQPNRQ